MKRVKTLPCFGAALTLVLGACGGSSHSATATPKPAAHAVKTAPAGPRVLLDSVLTTAAEKSARVSMSVSSTGGDAAGEQSPGMRSHFQPR